MVKSEVAYCTDYAPCGRVRTGAASVAAATVSYPGHRNELEISQEEIGYLSGVSRQRVNQALQVLARAKLVEVEYGSVRIVDLAALRRYGS